MFGKLSMPTSTWAWHTKTALFHPSRVWASHARNSAVIVAVDGEKVEDQQDLAQIMNNHRAGDTVRMTVYRGKKKMDVTVTLGEAREQV